MLVSDYEPYDFAEPGPPLSDTEGEFAPTQEIATTDEWAKNPLVQRALAAVGFPDGTPEWIERFSCELFALTEAYGEARRRLRPSLAQLEEWRLEVDEGKNAFQGRGTMYRKFVIEGGMTMYQTARYCGVDPIVIARQLCPSNPEGFLRAEELVLEGEQTLASIADSLGISRHAVQRHAKRLGVKPATKRRNTKASPEIVDRILELRAQDVKLTDISEIIAREFGRTLDQSAIYRIWKREAA